MKQTFQSLQKQIGVLQAQAEALRKSEVAEVISKIKAAITAYDLSAADLFGGKFSKATRTASSKATTGAKARSSVAKYSDDKGNTWVGLGKRPQWIRDALSAGATLEDFAQEAATTTTSRASTATSLKNVKRARKAPKKGPAAVKFRDAENSWSGYGPTPRWLKDAVAAGKKKEDFAV